MPRTCSLLVTALVIAVQSIAHAGDAEESRQILDAARRLEQATTPEQRYIERVERNGEIQRQLDELRERIEDESPGSFDDD